MLSNKKLNPIVIELFIGGTKLDGSLVFIMDYFAVPNNISLNYTCYFIMKIPNKRELQQIEFNHLSDIGYELQYDINREAAKISALLRLWKS